MFRENRTVIIFLFVKRRIDWKPFGGMSHLLIAYCFGRDAFQGVNPRIAYAVAELLLLTPGHLVGQHVLEGFTHDAFLDFLAGTHLGRWIGTHCHVKKLLVKERYTSFDTPGREALVGAQAVVHVEFGEFADGFLVEIAS